MKLYEQIKAIYPQLVAEDFSPFAGTISLRNDGEGDYIARWEHSELAKPTPEQLAAAAPTLDDLKETKIVEINAAFTLAAQALTNGYPEAERLTWPVQQAEALAWDADSEAPTPYIDGLAAARGVTPEEMRQKTLEQTQLFMAASQQLVGTRQRLRDLVHDATTPEALDAINWPA